MMVALAHTTILLLLIYAWWNCGIILKNTFIKHREVKHRIGNWMWVHVLVFTVIFFYLETFLIRYFEFVMR